MYCLLLLLRAQTSSRKKTNTCLLGKTGSQKQENHSGSTYQGLWKDNSEKLPELSNASEPGTHVGSSARASQYHYGQRALRAAEPIILSSALGGLGVFIGQTCESGESLYRESECSQRPPLYSCVNWKLMRNMYSKRLRKGGRTPLPPPHLKHAPSPVLSDSALLGNLRCRLQRNYSALLVCPQLPG